MKSEREIRRVTAGYESMTNLYSMTLKYARGQKCIKNDSGILLSDKSHYEGQRVGTK